MIVIAFVVVILILAWVLRKRYSERHFALSKAGKVLVRPPQLPIIGHLLHVIPENFITSMKELVDTYGPLLELYVFNKRAVVVADVELSREILALRPKAFRRARTMDNFAKPFNYHHTLFFSHGTEWSVQRRYTTPSFNKLNINSHVASTWQQANRWVDRMASEHQNVEIDFKAQAFSYTLRIMSKVAFGIEENDLQSYFNSNQLCKDVEILFKYAVEKVLFPLPEWLFAYSPFYKLEIDARAANKRLCEASALVIDEKKKALKQNPDQPRNYTFLDTMLRKDNGQLGEDMNLLENSNVFFMAGSETTSVTLSYAVYFLCKHPEVFSKLRDEADRIYDSQEKNGEIKGEDVELLKYAEAVFKESLRLRAPASFLVLQGESSKESVTLSNGIVLHPQDEVFVYIDGLNWDEKNFKDPMAFNPDRWISASAEQKALMESAFIPFGFGPRGCPGMGLAYMEGVLALAALARKVDFALACPESEIKRVQSFTAVPNKMPIFCKSRYSKLK